MGAFFLRKSADKDGANGTIPFEAELYAVAPERFGRWYDSGSPLPSDGLAALTEEQMRGEFALFILRWLCLFSLASAGCGLLIVLWRIAVR